MKIIDLDKKHEELYFVCLEDWSEEMKEAGDHKRRWYTKMKDKGLRVKLAINDENVVCGMVEYLPAEYAAEFGQGSYFISCLWVHGHKQGRGDQRKKGYGRALLAAAEEDAKALGAKGMATQGLSIPVWIPASFFTKHGYETADKNGITRLLYKKFDEDAKSPKFLNQDKLPQKGKNEGKVTITFLLNGYCPGRSIVYERAGKAVQRFGDKVVLETVDTSELETFREWGRQNELFIEDKAVTFGPPLPQKKLEKLISRQVKKL